MHQTASLLLAAALALALVAASVGDVRARIIPNRLNGAIAAAAPLWWWANGLSVWPDIAIQIGFALLLFGIFAGVFALGAMGGGDVKLIAALGLWLPPAPGLQMLVLMSIAGGVITVAMLIDRLIRRREGVLEVPYGVAIAASAIFVLGQRYLYQFG